MDVEDYIVQERLMRTVRALGLVEPEDDDGCDWYCCADCDGWYDPYYPDFEDDEDTW